MSPQNNKAEWIQCALSPVYFACTHIQIENASRRGWIPFTLWAEQRRVMMDLASQRYVLLLKARQLGMSWLTLTYALWLMLFYPSATVMLMSKRDDESMELLRRIKGMYDRLPDYLQAKSIVTSNEHNFVLSNDSKAIALPTSGGRSYTGSLVILDEADFLPDLNGTLNALRPTIDAGGQLFIISTVDKTKPTSTFKQIVRAAFQLETPTADNPIEDTTYYPIFLPWYAHPERTPEWYASIKAAMFRQTQSNDSIFQEYPATINEALAPLATGKRIPFEWIQRCYQTRPTLEEHAGPAIPDLRIYIPPQANHRYVIGADPAEGNPSSDDSAACVFDADTWEQCATARGKWEPKVFAGHLDRLGLYYNEAAVMAERNNHGHALILALRESGNLRIMRGHSAEAEKAEESEKLGWLSNVRGKTLMYDTTAQIIYDMSATLHDPTTVDQLASIEAGTLRAPPGQLDDHADACALALSGIMLRDQLGTPATIIPAPDPLAVYDQSPAW